MRFRVAAAVRQALLPYGVLVLAGAALPYCNIIFAPGTACQYALAVSLMGAALAWRFHAPRTMLALLLLAIVNAVFLSSTPASPATHAVLALLFPLNIAALLLIDEATFDMEVFGWWAAMVALQGAIALAICRADATSVIGLLVRPIGGRLSWPVLIFALVCLGLLVKLVVCRTAADSGLFWSTGTCLLAFITSRDHIRAGYFVLAAIVLGVAVVESSYRAAYNDELTGLPGRRAFNRALAAVDEQYSIAMLDIDYFKKFNDTYGHDVGDQVLRMVSSKLARVGGGGCAFRCGGEEFAIIFPGGARDAFPHAEALRELIDETPFVVRGPDRSHRRRKERRSHSSKRSLRLESVRTKVTVSVGLAEVNPNLGHPLEVVQAADKALYRAKESGRNRVEVHGFRRKKAAVAAAAR